MVLIGLKFPNLLEIGHAIKIEINHLKIRRWQQSEPLPSGEETIYKVWRTGTFKTRPEPGLDCLIFAQLARQRHLQSHSEQEGKGATCSDWKKLIMA